MDRSRHTRITELFGSVCDLPPDERRARLREACTDDPSLATEVERLLEAESGPLLQTPALGAGFSLTGASNEATDLAAHVPTRFGPYKVRRCISVGGMAVVYEAEQEQLHRTVALKVLRGGLLSRSALRRFQFETEVLGRLQHPGIARIYDAGMHRDATCQGSDPGVPYFAMELIDGLPIDEYARSRQLDLRGRMELIAKACDAVQHAHQQGVIHRDLKPANILVDGSGEPRILDFGVARAMGSALRPGTLQTEAGQLVGTLPYMSPEQVGGDPGEVDTRSDVYGLGVLLYELLAGKLPYAVSDAAIPEAARIILEEEPTPLASIDRALRGDPATIVGRALEKEKDRRYQSAAQLGADIRHFLADEPITARPASTLYQLGKLARRNRLACVALGIVVLTLAGATGVSTWMAVEAGRAKSKAVEALRESEGTSGYLLDLFLESPDQPTINRQQLLERAERRLIETPIREPRVEAKVREYVGHGWHKLNYLENAEPHLARALEIRRALGVRDEDLAQCLLLIAMQRLTKGDIPKGQAALRESLAIRRERLGPNHLSGAHDSELMYFTVVYTPDEPEALAEFERRRLLRGEQPVVMARPIAGSFVLEDDFDGDALGTAWSVELLNCTGWTHAVGGSRLTVSDIQPAEWPSASDPNKPSYVRLSRALPEPLADFHLVARIGWDSENGLEALQALVVWAYGHARHLIANEHYGDMWLQFRGARMGSVGRYGQSCRYVNSGMDTLPDCGTAELTIERIGDRVTAYWDGHEILRGISTDPLAELAIDFLWTVHAGADGKSSFGSEWIDSIRVTGTPGGAGR